MAIHGVLPEPVDAPSSGVVDVGVVVGPAAEVVVVEESVTAGTAIVADGLVPPGSVPVVGTLSGAATFGGRGTITGMVPKVVGTSVAPEGSVESTCDGTVGNGRSGTV
jgi:hypothetical protein